MKANLKKRNGALLFRLVYMHIYQEPSATYKNILTDLLLSSLPIAELHNGPLSAPSPLPCLVPATAFRSAQLLVLAFRQPDHNVSFARAQRKSTDTRTRTK